VLEDRIAQLDVTLFDHVAEAQSEPGDRRALLALHDGVAARGSFSYLEIGSYMGGSLQAAVADPRCTRIVSIDPRPQHPPDVRGGSHEYPDNSTARMLDLLAQVPGADVSKIEPIEASSEDLDPTRIEAPDLCFIDGEHTNEAVVRDAHFCSEALRHDGVIAFHDASLVEEGIRRFLRETGPPRRSYPLGFDVYVVELGNSPSLLQRDTVKRLLQRPRRAWLAANRIGADRLMWAISMRRRRLQYGKADGS
jgi:hypothetical protein